MNTPKSRQSSRKGNQTPQSTKPQAKKQISPLRQRMISDMELAGYTPGTQQSYISAVIRLQDHYRIRPDKLTEKQVQQCILYLHNEKKVPLGTLQIIWAGIKFFYYHTVSVDWPLITRKKVHQSLCKRLPVPIAWKDGHRLMAALKKPAYLLCCPLHGSNPRSTMAALWAGLTAVVSAFAYDLGLGKIFNAGYLWRAVRFIMSGTNHSHILPNESCLE